MATIITKNSQTASAVPAAASLSVGELAVNTADGKLYTEHTGGVVKEIIPSTVVDGGITTAKIVDANVTGAKLENSGVTAGTYGSASAIPAITVDAKGRITSASTNSFSSSYVGVRGQVFTSSGTFTVPSGVTAVKVTMCGGGGAGRFNSTGSSGGTSSFGGYVSASGGTRGATSSGGAGGGTSGADFSATGGNGGQAAGGGVGGSTNFGYAHVANAGLLGGNGGNYYYSGTTASGYGNGGTADSEESSVGGGAGGYAIKYVTGLTSGGTVSVTIGAGGTVGDSRGHGRAGIVFVEW